MTEERVTRSGRKVKSVVRYEPDEANLVDDFSDCSFGDSDFDGTLDGISDGSHLQNSDSSDESYTEKGATTENERDDDIDEEDLETDDDSVITEHVPDEEIIDIPSESDSSSSESSSDSPDDSSSNDEDSSSSSDDEDSSSSDGSDNSLPSIKHAWKKRRAA